MRRSLSSKLPGLRWVRSIRVTYLGFPAYAESCAKPALTPLCLHVLPPYPVYRENDPRTRLSRERVYECKSEQRGGFCHKCFGWDQGRLDCCSRLRVRGSDDKIARGPLIRARRRQLSSHPACGVAVLEVSALARPNKVGS